jgi:ribosomal protein S12 methylthiotransferase accessory factor
MLFSDRQYLGRNEINARTEASRFVPEPFDPYRRIEWTPLWSLSEGRFKYLPQSLSFFGCPDVSCVSDSSGSAAGNTLEEATLQGFLELIERDSVAIWWYNRIRRPAVNMDSFADPYLKELSAWYLGLGREIWCLDVTGDFGIPVFVALSRRIGAEREDVIMGFGAHLDAKIALDRAVTEMNQYLYLHQVAFSSHARAERELNLIRWAETLRTDLNPFLLPDKNTLPCNFTDYPAISSTDLRDDVLFCVSLAAERRLEVLVLDQTRPDIGLNVVKVVVPGLRPMRERFAPGRLFDVPAALGWLPEPLPESELNPMPVAV